VEVAFGLVCGRCERPRRPSAPWGWVAAVPGVVDLAAEAVVAANHRHVAGGLLGMARHREPATPPTVGQGSLTQGFLEINRLRCQASPSVLGVQPRPPAHPVPLPLRGRLDGRRERTAPAGPPDRTGRRAPRRPQTSSAGRTSATCATPTPPTATRRRSHRCSRARVMPLCCPARRRDDERPGRQTLRESLTRPWIRTCDLFGSKQRE
jgi:hypothetical protein